ncbi:MAG: outer membrane beta-barrel protein [Terracidiphilus sp.]
MKMRTKWMQAVLILVGMAALCAAQCFAQTDVAVSLYGAFSGTTTANGVAQSPSNAAGGMLEVRHISHPWLGYEGTYSINRANQTYRYVDPPSCPAGSTGPCGLQAVSADAHQVTGDWIASVKVAHVRPFALGGVGLLLDVPSSGQGASSNVKPVFVYGAGLDWGLAPHIGLRFQYRGNLYKAPNLTSLFTSVDRFTQTAEPMIGAYFRF